jgi:excisionase family DNA binding protein
VKNSLADSALDIRTYCQGRKHRATAQNPESEEIEETVQSGVLSPESLLTSYEAGALLQVNPSSINNWVRAGRIPAFRTPGGHLRIRARDLVQFLCVHKMPIPTNLEAAGRQRILITDDDPKQLASLRRVLKPHSDRLEVAFAENGVDALVQIGSFRPHLVVLDVYMPELDGLTVCRRLKKSGATKEIDLILMTGRLTPELERRAHEAGVRCCIQKPIKLDVLLREAGLGETATKKGK